MTECTDHKHGRSPDAEFTLALRAIRTARQDAGIDPREVLVQRRTAG